MALTHAILASLLEVPCSGYDLSKKFDGSVGNFWQATHQQIYRELSKMEEQGWLEAQSIRQESRPDKKVFSVTELGRAHLRAWITDPSEVSPIRDDLLVKVYAGYLVPPAILLQEMKAHRSHHQDRLATYQQIEQLYFNQVPAHVPQAFPHLTLKFGIRYETAWLAWCDEVIAQLSQSSEEGSQPC